MAWATNILVDNTWMQNHSTAILPMPAVGPIVYSSIAQFAALSHLDRSVIAVVAGYTAGFYWLAYLPPIMSRPKPFYWQ